MVFVASSASQLNSVDGAGEQMKTIKFFIQPINGSAENWGTISAANAADANSVQNIF